MNFKTLLSFIAAAGLLVSCTTKTSTTPHGAKLGLQSYTCRHMEFDELVKFAVEHHIKYLQLYSKHIDPNGSAEESKRKKAILDQNGLVCYTFGVTHTSMDKEQNRKIFEFAKLMGIKVIVVEPKSMDEWDGLEALVKEYNIRLAIHNHGLSSTYGNPETVKKILAARDARIGVCLDVGHLTGAGFDAATTFRNYNGRVYDIHLKDKKTVTSDDGKKKELDVFLGTGDSNYKDLFVELRKERWNGVLAIETDNDKFAQAPAEFVDSAIKFVKENLH